MYSVIRRYKFDQKNSRELDKKIQDIFVPLIEKAPGFISYHWMDSGRGEGASISIFENKKGTDESIRIAANFVKNNLSNIKLSPPEITEGEIQAHGERTPAAFQAKEKSMRDRPSAH